MLVTLATSDRQQDVRWLFRYALGMTAHRQGIVATTLAQSPKVGKAHPNVFEIVETLRKTACCWSCTSPSPERSFRETASAPKNQGSKIKPARSNRHKTQQNLQHYTFTANIASQFWKSLKVLYTIGLDRLRYVNFLQLCPIAYCGLVHVRIVYVGHIHLLLTTVISLAEATS